MAFTRSGRTLDQYTLTNFDTLNDLYLFFICGKRKIGYSIVNNIVFFSITIGIFHIVSGSFNYFLDA
jgi:hypothetical protein